MAFQQHNSAQAANIIMDWHTDDDLSVGRFLVTKVTFFLLAPINVKSVEPKFHSYRVSI